MTNKANSGNQTQLGANVVLTSEVLDSFKHLGSKAFTSININHSNVSVSDIFDEMYDASIAKVVDELHGEDLSRKACSFATRYTMA